jgi:hypothetical protein
MNKTTTTTILKNRNFSTPLPDRADCETGLSVILVRELLFLSFGFLLLVIALLFSEEGTDFGSFFFNS